MSPLPPWLDPILFPFAIASLFGYGDFLSRLLVLGVSRTRVDRTFDWGGEVEAWAVAYGLGYGFLSLSMLGLGLLGWLYDPLFWVVLAGGLFLFVRRFRRSSLSRLRSELAPRGGVEKGLFGFLFLYFGFRYLGCLIPGWGYDEMMYHLTLPRQFLFAHRVHPTPNLLQANLPLNAQMMFLFLLGLGGDVLCHLFQWAQYLVLGAIVIRWTRKANHHMGYLAFLIYCSSTLGVYFRAPEEVQSDTAVAVYFAVAMLVLTNLLPKNRMLGMVIAGILNGLAWGAKFTAFVFTTPLLMAYIVLRLRSRRVSWSLVVGGAILFTIVSTLVFAPWAARSYAFTGNPVYPLLDTLFPSPPPYDDMAGRLREYEAYSNFYEQDPVLSGGTPLSRPFRLVWAALRSLTGDKTAWSFQNGDFLLLLHLVAPFFGLASRGREIRRLCWTALVGNVMYVFVYGMHLSRFYTAVYPLAAVLFALLLGAASIRIRRPKTLRILISVFAIFSLCYWQYRWLFLQEWWGTPNLSTQSQRRFLIKRYGGEEAVEKDEGGWEKILVDLIPKQAYVLGHGVRLPIQSPRRMYYVGDFEEEFLDRAFRECNSHLEVAKLLRSEGFTHLLIFKKKPGSSKLPQEWLDEYTEGFWANDSFDLRKMTYPPTD